MPHKRLRFFPKQLFRRFLFGQLLLSFPAFIAIALFAKFYSQGPLGPALTIAFAATLIFTGISLWMAYKLVFPLGRAIVRARAISRKDYSFTNQEEDATGTYEAGEWSDLESTLNRIEHSMQSQDLRLSKEREEVEAIISAISEAVLAVDREGNLLFFNSQFAVLFGDRELQRRPGRLTDFFRNPDVLDIFRDTLRDGVTRTVNTQIHLKHEPVPRYFSLSVAPLRLRDMAIYGTVGVFHDVSELKHLDQVRIDFVANVSHELRTPLTSIKGYAQTLAEDLARNRLDFAPKYLETISRNVDRLIALVQDLLNLSSLESGAVLEKEEFFIREVTEKVLANLEQQRSEKHQNVVSKFETETLYADPKRVEQVLFNLVENAIKYVPSGKTIELRWSKGPGGGVCLHVLDDGPGIPAEHHARLFERFYRVDSARNRDQGGTGLGLAIVKHIMQRHGGTVTVQGGLGKGTEFVCCFPQGKE